MIDYTVIRSRRRTLALEVHPGGEVILRTPFHASQLEIDVFLRKKQKLKI